MSLPGCICQRRHSYQLERGFDIDPDCPYHRLAAARPWDHRIPWNCPTYWDGCNCTTEAQP